MCTEKCSVLKKHSSEDFNLTVLVTFTLSLKGPFCEIFERVRNSFTTSCQATAKKPKPVGFSTRMKTKSAFWIILLNGVDNAFL